MKKLLKLKGFWLPKIIKKLTRLGGQITMLINYNIRVGTHTHKITIHKRNSQVMGRKNMYIYCLNYVKQWDTHYAKQSTDKRVDSYILIRWCQNEQRRNKHIHQAEETSSIKLMEKKQS